MGVLARTEVYRPVNQIEIKVIKFELSKCVIKSGLDMGRIVLRVP